MKAVEEDPNKQIGRSNKQIDRCLFFCWPWVSIWFSSAGAQPRSAEEVAALDEDFYQRDIAAEYEDLDFDACEQFDVDDVYLGQNEVDAGGGVRRGRRRRRHGRGQLRGR